MEGKGGQGKNLQKGSRIPGAEGSKGMKFVTSELGSWLVFRGSGLGNKKRFL